MTDSEKSRHVRIVSHLDNYIALTITLRSLKYCCPPSICRKSEMFLLLHPLDSNLNLPNSHLHIGPYRRTCCRPVVTLRSEKAGFRTASFYDADSRWRYCRLIQFSVYGRVQHRWGASVGRKCNPKQGKIQHAFIYAQCVM